MLAWLRTQVADPRRIPVVVFAASREPDDIARAYDLGANSYFVKPDTFEDLRERIETLTLYWLTFNERSW